MNASRQQEEQLKQGMQAPLDKARDVEVSLDKGGLAVKTRDGSEVRRARWYLKGTIY